MASRSSRRAYRHIYRRVRFYVPLLLLLLGAMVFFLPLSPAWVRRHAEDALARAMGVGVRMDRLEAQVARGTVEAQGLTLVEPGGGGEFRLARLRLTGGFRELIAGDGRWPGEVLLAGPTPFEVVMGDDGGVELRGGGAVLAAVAARLAAADGATTGTRTAGAPAGGLRQTPRLILRDVQATLAGGPLGPVPVSLLVDELTVAERSSAELPVRVAARGVVAAETSEAFTLEAVYFPARERLTLSLSLGGLVLPVQTPLGRMRGEARSITMRVAASRRADGVVEGAVTVAAERFQMASGRLGGERWTEDRLEARVRGSFDPTTARLEVAQAVLQGGNLDVQGAMAAELRGDWPGRAEVAVHRVPPEAVALARNRLFDLYAIDIAPVETSPTLRLEGRLAGDLLRPSPLDANVSVRLAGWQVTAPALAAPLVVHNLSLRAGARGIELPALVVEYAGMRVRAYGSVPAQLDPTGPLPEPGRLVLEAEGDAAGAFALLARAGHVPADLTSLDAPVRLDGEVRSLLTRQGNVPALDLTNYVATLTIRPGGRIGWRPLGEALGIGPAVIRLRPGDLRLERLHATLGTLETVADARVTGDFLRADPGPLDFSGTISLAGSIEQAQSLAARFAPLPDGVPEFAGRFRIEASAEGNTADLGGTRYEARLQVSEGATTFETTYRTVALSGVTVDATLRPEAVELRRLAAQIIDPEKGNSTVRLSASLAEDRLRADLDVKTHFEWLTAILAADLQDVVMEGRLPLTGEVTLRPSAPLPPGPDVLRRWMALATRPGLRIGTKPDNDIVADYRVEFRQAVADANNNVRIFPREFPLPLERVRGVARFTPEGLKLERCQADYGSSRDLQLDGWIRFERPLRIEVDVRTDLLVVDEWTSGWGEQPWASKPVAVPGVSDRMPETVPIVVVEGRVRAKQTRFQRFEARNVATQLRVDVVVRRPTELLLTELEMDFYDGRADGMMHFIFAPGQRPWMTARANFQNANLHRFMHDLAEAPEEEYDPGRGLDGLLTGDLVFNGQLLNYPTYAGDARFRVVDSAVVGQVILPYARDILQLGSGGDGRTSVIVGVVECADQKVHFTRLDIVNPALTMTANGYIDFQGRLFFDVSASAISQRLRNIPVVEWVGSVIDLVGKEAVYTYRVRGELGRPFYYPIPRIVEHMATLGNLLRESARLFAPTARPGAGEQPPQPR
jgi:hypothetical protein